MVALLEEAKFRAMLSERYPFIFIDEYQDTDSEFAKSILTHFVTPGAGPLFGFFGDHWQKIYGNGCGKISSPNLEVIGKEANFRSVPAIVHVLNRLRPELPQAEIDPDAKGSVAVYHTNDWTGERLSGPHTRGDLPPVVAHTYLRHLRHRLEREGWDFDPEETKILMLTHRVLADEQGYRQLADVFPRNESYIQKEDPHIAFFVDVLEPICTAYEAGHFGEMFSMLGDRRPSIKSRDDKASLKREMDELLTLRSTETVGRVIDFVHKSRMGVPNAVERKEEMLQKDDAENSAAVERLQALRAISYRQIMALAHLFKVTRHSKPNTA